MGGCGATLRAPELVPRPHLRRDADGNSALHHAAFCGLSATFKALHAAGARSYEPSAAPGWTPASVRDGVLTRCAARLHRHLTIRGALGHYPGAVRAACRACAVAWGEEEETDVLSSAGPAAEAAAAARDPYFSPAWALEQIDAGTHESALAAAQVRASVRSARLYR